MRVIDNIDVADGDDVARLAEDLADVGLDILVNNAGILRSDTIDTVNFEHMLDLYRVNTLGPLRVIQALFDNVRREPAGYRRKRQQHDGQHGDEHLGLLSRISRQQVGVEQPDHDAGCRLR